jgi:hypothetical protein
MQRFWSIPFSMGLFLVLCVLSGITLADDDSHTNMHFRDNPPSPPTPGHSSTSTADHSKFEVLQQSFTPMALPSPKPVSRVIPKRANT